ncbi:MAG: MnmC family methyltransferase [Cyanobacteria bacterium J06592_8]
MDKQHFKPQATADGSYTFYSLEFGESFHSQFGAKQEAEQKFVEPLQLRQRVRQRAEDSPLFLLDICYGLGYNTAAALTAIWDVNPDCQVELIALELDETVPKSAIAYQVLNDYPPEIVELLTQFATTHYFKSDRLEAKLLIGDARHTLQQVQSSGFQADAIFLDPFSPPVCPQLWTVEFLGLLANCLKPDGHLATYSCSAAVRSALLAVKLNIGSTPPVGRRTPGTIASFSTVALPPLSTSELEHLQTRAAVPYRDPNLNDTAEIMIKRRQQEQQSSNLEATSQWKKRLTRNS